ncbi:hypothetical protein BofuT4_P110990.1 [Botrytis cinerea T4]|uniref:Uncharacterized protein n=1 Tax=Botryotinia fuckeliana (strain T4) TaxID=999810 RepID=G2Y634_BOTF4|nr:hypothetical protein BofuT4_P110990.1 [Botrytis cinerea T4]
MLPYYQHQWEGAFEIYGTDPFSMLLAPSMTSLKMAIRMSPIQKSAENHILLQQHGHQALSRQGPIILHPQRILSDAKTYKVTCKCIVSTNCYCSHITGSLFGPVKPRSKIQCGDKRRTICRACVHGDLPGSVWNLISACICAYFDKPQTPTAYFVPAFIIYVRNSSSLLLETFSVFPSEAVKMQVSDWNTSMEYYISPISTRVSDDANSRIAC